MHVSNSALYLPGTLVLPFYIDIVLTFYSLFPRILMKTNAIRTWELLYIIYDNTYTCIWRNAPTCEAMWIAIKLTNPTILSHVCFATHGYKKYWVYIWSTSFTAGLLISDATNAFHLPENRYHQISDTSRTLEGNAYVDNSDVVATTTVRRDE